MDPRTLGVRSLVIFAVTSAVALALFGGSALGAGVQMTIVSKGTTSLQGGATGSDEFAFPEFRVEDEGNHGKAGLRSVIAAGTKTIATAIAAAPTVKGHGKVAASSELLTDWLGLTHRDQRLASGGNQFSLEPPDQGLCVGNGFVLETVNAAIRVYDTSGRALTAPTSLNQFYGYVPSINRTTGKFGPFLFDVSCHYDPATSRWFHLTATVEVNADTGAETGKNHLDLAVSETSSPLGSWRIYSIPAQNDGTDGTPNHHCPGGPCFGDFPHIGADANGIYITTNEFPFFKNGFIGAQIYALPKQALVSGAPSVPLVLFNTNDFKPKPGQAGFTVWPALSAGTEFSTDAGGTEYFLSSNAVFDAARAESTDLITWALTNTSSLNSTPNLQLRSKVVTVNRYGVPASSVQKAGPFPLGECINDTTASTPFGPGCWQFLFTQEPAHNAVIGPIDTSDSRISDVRYANGKLWGVLGTAAEVNGKQRAGAAWYVLTPSATSTAVSATVVNQGILAAESASLAYPTLGITNGGRGAIGFTLVGENDFPSAAYSLITSSGVSDIRIAEAGAGPQDGFTEYSAFTNRPRWGDYGAAAVDGSQVYLANEYIAQSCTLSEFLKNMNHSPLFSCDRTRTVLANWATRISKLQP